MIQLTFHPGSTIESLQEQLRSAFPFLTLGCFSPSHGRKDPSKEMMLPPDTVLAKYMKAKAPVTVSFERHTTVRELERQIQNDTGLRAQVFRKSGKVWLKTTATDSWTLQEQDDEGRRAATERKAEVESPDDHDIY